MSYLKANELLIKKVCAYLKLYDKEEELIENLLYKNVEEFYLPDYLLLYIYSYVELIPLNKITWEFAQKNYCYYKKINSVLSIFNTHKNIHSIKYLCPKKYLCLNNKKERKNNENTKNFNIDLKQYKRCYAICKNGNRCRNNFKNYSLFCIKHQNCKNTKFWIKKESFNINKNE